jgi:hypothetical protein
MRFSISVFFHEVCHWGCFAFFKNSRRYLRINFYHECQRHRRKDVQWCQRHQRKKFIAGVISPCHGFSVIAGVVDIRDKFIIDTGDQLSAVTATPPINLLPVTRTRMPWRWGAAKDRRKMKGINRRYFRPPKSASAADYVIGTAMKSCIHTHPTHLDQRPLRPPKLNNAVLVCGSFGGLRGLRACQGPLRLFVAVPVTILAAVADFGGRS